jgi:hypothetical protein
VQLEAVHRNSLQSAADEDVEGLRAAPPNHIRAAVRRRERRRLGSVEHVHMSCSLQLVRDPARLVEVTGETGRERWPHRRRRHRSLGDRSGGECRLTLQAELLRRYTRVFFGCSPQAHQHPWQVGRPAGATLAGAQRLLQLMVKTFHHAVRLGMVCCHQDMSNPQFLTQCSPHRAGKLRTSVRRDEVRYAEARDPDADDGVRAGLRRSGDHGDGLYPPGGPVDDRQEMRIPLLRGWKRPHQVNMKMRKTAVWDGDGLQRRPYMACHLASVASLALAAPVCNIRAHTQPHKPGFDEPFRGPHPWMSQVVYAVQQQPAVRGGL